MMVLYNDYRKYLIDSHNFNADQAKKRLLNQFENILEEAEQFEKEWLKKNSLKFDHENGDEGSFIERAFQESVCYYNDLQELKSQSKLLVINSMFHTWERYFRSFLLKESRYWGKLLSIDIQEKIKTTSVDNLFQLIEYFGWDIKAEDFYPSFEACQLIVNCSKHGTGPALEKLLKKYPLYIKDSWRSKILISSPNIFDDFRFDISNENIEEFSDSIMKFWEHFPENLKINANSQPPTWLKKYLI